MCCQGRSFTIPSREVHIVQQQTHPHPPVGRVEQFLREQPAYQVVMIEVVLYIYGSLCCTGQKNPSNKGVETVCQKPTT